MGTNKPNAEQPAFAVNSLNTGLTKRELLAAMAMEAMVTAYISTRDKFSLPGDDIIAAYAVMQADELLKALSK